MTSFQDARDEHFQDVERNKFQINSYLIKFIDWRQLLYYVLML